MFDSCLTKNSISVPSGCFYVTFREDDAPPFLWCFLGRYSKSKFIVVCREYWLPVTMQQLEGRYTTTSDDDIFSNFAAVSIRLVGLHLSPDSM